MLSVLSTYVTPSGRPAPTLHLNHWVGAGIVWCWCFWLGATPVWSQTTSPEQADPVKLQAEIDQLFREWKELLQTAAQARVDYTQQDRAQSVDNRTKYEQAFDRALAKKGELEKKLIEKLDVVEKPDESLMRMVKSIAQDLFLNEQMERCFQLSTKLLRHAPDDEDLLLIQGGAAITTNRFEEAETFRKQLGSLVTGLPDTIQTLYSQLPELREAYARELEIRAKEAQADDLPRVLIRTTKGDIVVELFENEAPETVGNFIFLVETGFYNRELNFHRVISGFVAQGGEDPTGQPYYTIFDEHGTTQDRPHFAYTLAMARTEQANSAAAEFYITFYPVFGLNQNYTTFGRVIEGFEVVDRLNRTAKPNKDGVEEELKGAVRDKILSAKVLRKRDHVYRPKKFQEFKPEPTGPGSTPSKSSTPADQKNEK